MKQTLIVVYKEKDEVDSIPAETVEKEKDEVDIYI